MATDSKTFMEDRESLRALVQCLPDDLLKVYDSYQALNLESGFPGRKLVAFTLKGGRPTNIELFTLGPMRMSASGGPTIELTSSRQAGVLTIGMIPAKLPGQDVFIHVPQKFEFRWKARNGATGGVNFAPHYALLIKSRSKPHLAIDGDTYCVRLNQFREMFPDTNVGY